MKRRLLHTVDAVLGRAANAAGHGEALLGDARRTLSFLRGRLAFRPRTTDVYVVSYPRSGTTWMQLMLYRLVGHDRVDFDHISQVSPWFERSLAIGSLSADDFEDFPSPRIMKSHLPYGWLPRLGRVVYVWRDGRDVAVSYFHFYRSHLGYPHDFPTFFQSFLRGELQYRSWFDHVAGWMAHAQAPGVLIVRYEDLQRNRVGVLRQVARHVGLNVSDDRLARVIAETSFDAMKGQESKFDHATALLLERRRAPHAFLRNGVCGEGLAALDDGQRQAYAARLGTTTWRGLPEGRLPAFLH
jgi:hypothetical protein